MSVHDAMYVAYASDDGYARFLGISMLSLFESNQAAPAIEVFILDSGIHEENRARLQSIAARYRRELHWIPVHDHLGRLELHMGARKISAVSYARLFLASLLPPHCDRVLYLDCDTVVCDSLTDMYQTPLGNALVAGVADTVDAFYPRAIGMLPGCRYVNAGILLIHLALWRAEEMETRFLEAIDRFGGNVPHHDQGVINSVCGARRVILPLRYNVTSNVYSFTAHMIRRMYDLDVYYDQSELLTARDHPAIVHFTTGLTGRPWEMNCRHPQRVRFVQFEALSPWAKTPLLPDQTKKSVRMTEVAHRVLPDSWFAFIYHCSSWIIHQKK